MLNEVISLEKKYLNFELGEEQRNVLLSIFNFINDKDDECCTINGFGGTGKTTITKLIIRYLENKGIPYMLAAPTHKAKNVMKFNTDRDAITVHQLLTLSPVVDIMELDFKDLKFNSVTIDNQIPNYGVLIIDECSMVNEVLFDYVTDRCSDKNCKIIWIGDDKQLSPVKDQKLSRAFNIKNVFNLTKIFRQKDTNPIVDVLKNLRFKSTRNFEEFKSNSGSLLIYDNWKTVLDDTYHLFKKMIDDNNPNYVKLIAYTNKRVSAFNEQIRKKLFNTNEEYIVGDLLMGYDSCEYKINNRLSHKINNSCDYLVLKSTPKCKAIRGVMTKGFDLEIYSFEEDYSFNIYILSKENSDIVFRQLSHIIESVRTDAVKCLNKKEKNRIWVDYFNLMGSFLSPIDMSYMGRIIRKKSIDYGYCITSHKS